MYNYFIHDIIDFHNENQYIITIFILKINRMNGRFSNGKSNEIKKNLYETIVSLNFRLTKVNPNV